MKPAAAPPIERHRLMWLVLEVGIVAMGLGMRRYGSTLSAAVADYGGDTLWALMVFVGIGLVMHRWPTWRVTASALCIAYGTETGQLYHAPWIDHLRQTVVGGLVLGRGFLWSDLVCYTVGIGFGMLAEICVFRPSA